MLGQQPTRVLTLDECLAAARSANLDARRAELDLQAARFARRETMSTAFPQLRITGNGVYSPANRHFGSDPIITDVGELRGQVVAEQSLYDFGRRRLKLRQSDLDIGRLAAEQEIVRRERDLEVRQAFVEGLRAQNEIVLRDEGVSQLSDYLELVRSLSAGGTVAATDVLRTRVELSTATIAAAQARQTLAATKLTLAELMGQPADTAFTLSGALDDTSTARGDAAGVAAPLDTLGNLDLAAARLAFQRANADVVEARQEGLPNLTLAADAGYLSSRENLLSPGSERYNGIGASAGLSLEWPILDWGGRRYRVQERRLAAESARLQAEIVRRQTETQYRTAIMKLTSSRTQLDSIRAAIKTAEDNFLLTKAKYAGGGVPASEVLSAQQLLTETRLSELETLAAIQTLRATLERLNARQ